jgi:hypothetical protein
MDTEKLGMQPASAPPRTRRRGRLAVLGLTAFVLLALQARTALRAGEHTAVHVPLHAQEALAKCQHLHTKPA